MTQTVKSLTIVLALALSVAANASIALSQTHPDPSPAGKALEDPLAPSGKVVETMDAGAYSYVCLEKSGTKTWVAVPKMKVAVGEEMAFGPGGEMVNFTSKILNRTFPSIIFSGGPQVAKSATDDAAVKDAHGGKPLDELKKKEAPKVAAKAVVGNEKIEKAVAANAYTVAELFEKRSALDKQKVIIKGKVVKVSSGILGKNWVHLQDGSGDVAQGTNKVIVTTQDTAAIGDVITSTGTLYKDKDFGAGYKYDMIIEEATLQH